jgi:hypothetical protein
MTLAVLLGSAGVETNLLVSYSLVSYLGVSGTGMIDC